jgi:hypothetical protein
LQSSSPQRAAEAAKVLETLGYKDVAMELNTVIEKLKNATPATPETGEAAAAAEAASK